MMAIKPVTAKLEVAAENPVAKLSNVLESLGEPFFEMMLTAEDNQDTELVDDLTTLNNYIGHVMDLLNKISGKGE